MREVCIFFKRWNWENSTQCRWDKSEGHDFLNRYIQYYLILKICTQKLIFLAEETVQILNRLLIFFCVSAQLKLPTIGRLKFSKWLIRIFPLKKCNLAKYMFVFYEETFTYNLGWDEKGIFAQFNGVTVC